MVEKICSHCGSLYLVKPYLESTSKFCSRKCLALASRIEHTSTCAICNTEFTHISSRSNKAKYCSRACYYKSLRGKGQTTFICAHCGKSFNASKSTKRKYCSRACVNKSSLSSFKASFTTVRKQMIARDMIKKCAHCGFDAVPQILGVHHIDRNRENNDLSNLIVLCPNCHSIEHMKHIAH